MSEDADIGFEEGMSWLPSHVLDEACGDRYPKEGSKERIKSYSDDHYRRRYYHQHDGIRLVGEPLQHSQAQHAKGGVNAHTHHRRRHPNHRASGGSGMQAIFLDSGHKTGGTGVFLPRTAGSNFNPCKKPAGSPVVLLPSRVIQALNLNVHALGSLQVTSPRDLKGEKRNEGINYSRNHEGKDVTSPCSVISPNPSPSEDVFLPKEWSY